MSMDYEAAVLVVDNDLLSDMYVLESLQSCFSFPSICLFFFPEVVRTCEPQASSRTGRNYPKADYFFLVKIEL